jgi:hypothetical protein
MGIRLSKLVAGAAVAVALVMVGRWSAGAPSVAPAPANNIPRTTEGKPDLNGIWQVLTTAAWDIQDHVGALGVPPGQSVVPDNEIPYTVEAASQKQKNYAARSNADPERRCFVPGVPRATYQPFPFQLVQTPTYVILAYEYAHTDRTVYLDGSQHPEGLDFWMGDSRGRWEDDTLVVDVTNFNDQTWLDRSGNFHSDVLHVVERYTPIDATHLSYDATIEDSKVFTRPWSMNMILYRRMEPDLQLLEYECVAYLQEQAVAAGGRK